MEHYEFKSFDDNSRLNLDIMAKMPFIQSTIHTEDRDVCGPAVILNSKKTRALGQTLLHAADKMDANEITSGLWHYK